MIEIPVCTCFVDGCAWRLSHADVELKIPFSLKWKAGETLDQALNENSRKWHARVEEMIRGHLETHDVMEWARTVTRLRQDLAQVDSGVRPHAPRRSVFDTGDLEAYWTSRNERE